jgi:hypothetical protein
MGNNYTFNQIATLDTVPYFFPIAMSKAFEEILANFRGSIIASQ